LLDQCRKRNIDRRLHPDFLRQAQRHFLDADSVEIIVPPEFEIRSKLKHIKPSSPSLPLVLSPSTVDAATAAQRCSPTRAKAESRPHSRYTIFAVLPAAPGPAPHPLDAQVLGNGRLLHLQRHHDVPNRPFLQRQVIQNIRRRGSATALKASEVVAALAMPKQYILIWEYVKRFFCTAHVCRPHAVSNEAGILPSSRAMLSLD